MKVGIVTHYYQSENYGGNLQAYALCRIVGSLGHDVEQISYKRPLVKGKLRAIKKALLKAKAYIHPITKRNIEKRKKAILSFNEKIPHSPVYVGDKISECVSEYDAFITGSDQVWHPMAVCDAYLLKFAPSDKVKLSYSASVACKELSDANRARYKKAFYDFCAISVREKDAVSLISGLTDKEVELTLDPTLLLDKEQWLEIAEPSGIDKGYVFCYFLGESREQRKIACEYARKNGLKIATLPNLRDKHIGADSRFGDYKLYDVTPNRLISLINDADCVFTDSFHVSVFSNLLEKEHFVFHRIGYNDMSARIYTLAELFNTQARFCDTVDKLNLSYIESVIGSKLNSRPEALILNRERSIAYLKRGLAPKEKRNRIEITDPSKCSGCHSCFSACPKGCISMTADSEGFLYPTVNDSECVLCGACIKACPIITKKETENKIEEITAYGAYNRDESIRQKSSSGGIFTLLAQSIIERGGVVFGASFNEDFSVSHSAALTVSDLAKFRGSKYVQSTIGNAYEEAQRYLKEGRAVLFTGTPCQIGGLYSYLGKDYDNLYTQDIICHGVPSPSVWKSYIEQRKKEAEANNVSSVFFKDKRTGWKTYSISIEFDKDKSYTKRASADSMMRAFMKNLCLRPSCHECAFKEKVRQSDITLADYWGADTLIPRWDDDKGLSLVIVNSSRGRELFDSVKDKTEHIRTDFEKAIVYNSSMIKSAKASVKRDGFMSEIPCEDFDSTVNKYITAPKRTFKGRVKSVIKKILRRFKI